MIKHNSNITTKLNDKIIVKKVYNFIKVYYNNFDIISIDVEFGTIDIYMEERVYNRYRDVFELQENIKHHLKENFEYDARNINIIKL